MPFGHPPLTQNAARGRGGSPPPAWVVALAAPDGSNPLVVLDFANNRYWDGTSEVTAANGLTTDPDGGYFNGGVAACELKGSLLTAVLVQHLATWLVSFVNDFSGTGPFSTEGYGLYIQNAGNTSFAFLGLVTASDGLNPSTAQGSYRDDDATHSRAHTSSAETGGILKYGVTFKSGTAVDSTNGAAVNTQTAAAPAGPYTKASVFAPPGGSITGGSDSGAALNLVCIYTAQSDTNLRTLTT